MLPISVKDIITVEPDGEAGALYKIKIPTVAGKIHFQRELLALGARYPSDRMIRESLRGGIIALVESDQQPELLEIIDQIDAVPDDAQPDGDLLNQYTELLDQVRERHTELAEMLADRVVFFDLYSYAAVKMFLVDIERGAEFKRTGLQVSEDTIASIPANHLTQIGIKFAEVLSVTGKSIKNLKPQSQYQNTPETSIAEVQPQMAPAGNSAENII